MSAALLGTYNEWHAAQTLRRREDVLGRTEKYIADVEAGVPHHLPGTFVSLSDHDTWAARIRHEATNAVTMLEHVGIREAARYLRQCGWQVRHANFVLCGSEVSL